MRLNRKDAPSSSTYFPPLQADRPEPVAQPPGQVSGCVSIGLHRWAVLTAMATLALVCIGGLVTSHGVGMAVPDWPNTYGYNMFFFPVSKWVGGIFYEHTHRLVASSVGLMTTVLALWLYGRKARSFLRWAGVALVGVAVLTWLLAPARWADAVVAGLTGGVALAASFAWPKSAAAPKWLRRLGIVALFAVVLQGVLGGLRVILFKDQIGIFHAALAQVFFVLVCSIALFTSNWWQRTGTEGEGLAHNSEQLGRLHWFFLGSTLLILCQLIVGATMRHQHAGLSIPDFPLAYGKLWPATDPASIASYNQHRLEVTAANPITAAQIVLQMVHRLTALGILAAVAFCAWSARSRLSARNPIARVTLAWLGLILLQVLLGAATIWSNKAADLATGHVLIGAVSLATGWLLCVVAFRQARLRENPVRLPALQTSTLIPLSARHADVPTA